MIRFVGLHCAGPMQPESYIFRRCHKARCFRRNWSRDVNAAINKLVLFVRWVLLSMLLKLS